MLGDFRVKLRKASEVSRGHGIRTDIQQWKTEIKKRDRERYHRADINLNDRDKMVGIKSRAIQAIYPERVP